MSLKRPGPLVLVIDGDLQVHRFLHPILRDSGYDVAQAATAWEGLLMFKRQTPDVILLDLELPDLDGRELLARLRVISELPVLIISAINREIDKIEALDAGANDYVEKPFGAGELLARLRVALRSRRDGEFHPNLNFSGLTIDSRRRLALAGEKRIVMTPREWSLLLKLAQNAGRVLTHTQLLVSVWGPARATEIQYLRVYIAALRRKLGRAGDLIRTEVGVGYRMAETLDLRERKGR